MFKPGTRIVYRGRDAAGNPVRKGGVFQRADGEDAIVRPDGAEFEVRVRLDMCEVDNSRIEISGGVTVHIGHVLDRLRVIPDQSWQMCVTSPPYWGLRNYKTPPQIWGSDPDCSHEWGDAIRTPWANAVPGPNGRVKNSEADQAKAKYTGPFCQRCGAWKGELGLEPTPQLFVQHIVEVFREVWRVLRDDGTLWINMGDCYATGAGSARSPGGKCFGKANEAVDSGAFPMSQPNRMPIPGLKPKDLVGIPWRVALALQDDGWYLRSDIIWSKPNPMPESIRDRPTKSHEYLFLLSKSEQYFYDKDAIAEDAVSGDFAPITGWMDVPGSHCTLKHNTGERPSRQNFRRENSKRGIPQGGASCGTHRPNRRDSEYDLTKRNARTVWTIPTQAFPGSHYATFPSELPRRCIKAGSKVGDVVGDIFVGTGTTLKEARALGRFSEGIDLDAGNVQFIRDRLNADQGSMAADFMESL